MAFYQEVTNCNQLTMGPHGERLDLGYHNLYSLDERKAKDGNQQ